METFMLAGKMHTTKHKYGYLRSVILELSMKLISQK
jgi:hypothetical protein